MSAAGASDLDGVEGRPLPTRWTDWRARALAAEAEVKRLQRERELLMRHAGLLDDGGGHG